MALIYDQSGVGKSVPKGDVIPYELPDYITETNKQHLQEVQDNRNPCPICGDGVRVEDICSHCMDRIHEMTCDMVNREREDHD